MKEEDFNNLKSKDKKLLMALNALDDSTKNETFILNRQEITEKLQGAYRGVDRRVIYSMINTLIGMKVLEHNPTSQLITKKFSLGNPFFEHTKTIIMPTNDTRYFVHKRVLIGERQILLNKCTPTHPMSSTQTQLIST